MVWRMLAPPTPRPVQAGRPREAPRVPTGGVASSAQGFAEEAVTQHERLAVRSG